MSYPQLTQMLRTEKWFMRYVLYRGPSVMAYLYALMLTCGLTGFVIVITGLRMVATHRPASELLRIMFSTDYTTLPTLSMFFAYALLVLIPVTVVMAIVNQRKARASLAKGYAAYLRGGFVTDLTVTELRVPIYTSTGRLFLFAAPGVPDEAL